MAIFKLPLKSQTHKKEKKLNTNTMTEEEAANADLARAFSMMVCGDVQFMKLALNEARGLYEPQRAQQIKSRLTSIAFRLKNQGTVFGYPLVSDVAAHLYRFISTHDSYDTNGLNIINNDILLLQNILWKRITGDGGKKGQEILAQLT